MDNREFAQVLLSEASEILNEAGARQKYLKTLADKQDELKDRIKREEKLISHGKSDTDLKKLRSEYDDLADEAARYSARVGRSTTMGSKTNGNARTTGEWKRNEANRKAEGDRYRKPDEEASKRMHDEIDNQNNISSALKDKKRMHGNTSHDLGEYNRYNTGSYGQHISRFDRKAKRDFNEDFASKKPKNVKLHERINKRSQNESIAVLLTEAALLLNEGAVKSDHKRKQKLNKAKADFEKSIIRAREAGVPEDMILKSKEDIDNYFIGTNKNK